MKLSRLAAAALVATLFAACNTPEEPPKDNENINTEPPVEGTTLVSGEPIVATLDGGLAPFVLGENLSHEVVGALTAKDGGGDDLFVVGRGGIDNSGLHSAHYVRSSSDCRLIYASGKEVSQHPWKADHNLRIAAVDNHTLAFTFEEGVLGISQLDEQSSSFGTAYVASLPLAGVPEEVAAIEVESVTEGKINLLLLGLTVVSESPEMDDVTHSYYDTLGTYRGEMSVGALWSVSLSVEDFALAAEPRQIGPDHLIIAPAGVCTVGEGLYAVANTFGAIKFIDSRGTVTQPTDPQGAALRNRSVVEGLCTLSDGSFIASGEGVMMRYCHQADGSWHSEEVLMEGGVLYAGSMAVPNVVDWDADGRLDIVVGNSSGNIVFFRNRGTNALPAFGEGELLRSAGEIVEIRAGYYSPGGPEESGWGFLCPTVVDWNGDGVLDVVYSFNEGILEVMHGIKGGAVPELGRREKIMQDNMEVAGMWRVRPAVATQNGTTYLVTMDVEDRIHIYERRVGNAVIDRGLATLNFSEPITGYRSTVVSTLSERGREKLHLTDWDSDGDLDLLVGVPITASFPSPSKGLPWSRYPIEGLNVLFLENIGSNKEMSFTYPRQMLFKGRDLSLGTLSIAPTTCGLGDTSAGDNLLVGCDNGTLYFFSRTDLSRTISLW